MNECFVRLMALGFKTHDALHICEDFKRYFDLKHLNDFITGLESEGYVAEVQS